MNHSWSGHHEKVVLLPNLAICHRELALEPNSPVLHRVPAYDISRSLGPEPTRHPPKHSSIAHVPLYAALNTTHKPSKLTRDAMATQEINWHLLGSCCLLVDGQPSRALQRANEALAIATERHIYHLECKSELYRGLSFKALGQYRKASLTLARAANVRGWAFKVRELMIEVSELAREKREEAEREREEELKERIRRDKEAEEIMQMKWERAMARKEKRDMGEGKDDFAGAFELRGVTVGRGSLNSNMRHSRIGRCCE